MEKDIREMQEQLKQINILLRVNNVLLSKFVLQMQAVRRELHIPQLRPYFRFELLETEYEELIEEFDRKDVDKALYYLDRMLVNNKMNCPNNIKKFITARLKKLATQKRHYDKEKAARKEESRDD